VVVIMVAVMCVAVVGALVWVSGYLG
jgi:hypothetical protein